MLAKSYTAASLLVLSSLPCLAIDDIPYGVEAVTQFRSEYNFRGFQLAEETTSFQLGLRYAANDTTHLNVAAWHDSENGEGDFSEAGALLALGKDIGDASFGISTTYRSYSHSLFENGLNLEASASYLLTENLTTSANIAYDTGADGFYTELKTAYYVRINDDSFLNLSSGISLVSDYYQLSGLNNAFAKISYSYNINSSVSISPYIGGSLLLDNQENRSDSLNAGIYFAVSF